MDFKSTTNGDFAIENNDFPLVDGIDLVKQLVTNGLRLFLGEAFSDVTAGVPYFQEILKKGVEINTVSSILKNDLLQKKGVLSLKSFDLDFDERNLSVLAQIQAKDGIIILNEVLV